MVPCRLTWPGGAKGDGLWRGGGGHACNGHLLTLTAFGADHVVADWRQRRQPALCLPGRVQGVLVQRGRATIRGYVTVGLGFHNFSCGGLLPRAYVRNERVFFSGKRSNPTQFVLV